MARYNERWIKHFPNNSWVGCHANSILAASRSLSQPGRTWLVSATAEAGPERTSPAASKNAVCEQTLRSPASGHWLAFAGTQDTQHSNTLVAVRQGTWLWRVHFKYAQRSTQRYRRVSLEQGPCPVRAPPSGPRTGSTILVSVFSSFPRDGLGCVALAKGKQNPVRDV